MTNYPFASLDEIADIEGANFAREARARGKDPAEILAGLRAHGRDNARTPMQWDGTANAGFTTGTPWLPVNPNYVTINAEAQRRDPASVYHHYRRLIALRHDDPVVVHGDFTMLLPDDEQVYAFTRRWADQELLVVVNVSSDPAQVVLDLGAAWAGADLVLGGPDPDLPAAQARGGRLALQPWEFRVLRRAVDG